MNPALFERHLQRQASVIPWGLCVQSYLTFLTQHDGNAHPPGEFHSRKAGGRRGDRRPTSTGLGSQLRATVESSLSSSLVTPPLLCGNHLSPPLPSSRSSSSKSSFLTPAMRPPPPPRRPDRGLRWKWLRGGRPPSPPPLPLPCQPVSQPAVVGPLGTRRRPRPPPPRAVSLSRRRRRRRRRRTITTEHRTDRRRLGAIDSLSSVPARVRARSRPLVLSWVS